METESSLTDNVTANQGSPGATPWPVDINTAHSTLTNPWSQYQNATLGAGSVGATIKAGPAKPHAIVNASNYLGSTIYVCLFNKATPPVLGDTPWLVILVQNTASLARECYDYECTIGLSVGASSTSGTFTPVSSAACNFVIQYK